MGGGTNGGPRDTSSTPPAPLPLTEPSPSPKVPREALAKLGLALVFGLPIVVLVPRLGSDGDEPSISVLLVAGFLVGIAVLSVLYWTLTRDLRLPRAIVVYALSFNALVMIVKFIIAPDAIYEVNKKVAFTGFFNVGDPIGTAAAAVLVLLLYVFVYWLVYSRFRTKVLGRRALKLRDRIISKRKSLLIMLGGVVLMAMAGGGFVLLIPLVGVVSGAQYLEFVFSSAASLVIALTLAGATVLAHMAFRGAAERAVLVGDVALFVSFFWVGLAFLALYHVLWVVYVLVLTSIWPLKVVVPK